MENIYIGSIVTIIDGSYMLCIDPIQDILTKYPSGMPTNLVSLEHKFKVISINQPCPNNINNVLEVARPANNIIIKDLTNGLYWFCSEINLNVVES